MVGTPLERLEATLGAYPSLIVAFSGGVDSSVVAAAAQRVKGHKAMAVTLRGPSTPTRDLAMAREVVKVIGIRHLEVPIDQLTDEKYAENPSNRCYFCRCMEGEKLAMLAREMGVEAIVDGVHKDDLMTDRPGLKAMAEWRVRHPLVEAGLNKEEVRSVARELGLPNSEMPSNSCLSSRIAHGEGISQEVLDRVDVAEDYVVSLGFKQVRVRVKGGEARVQVDRLEVPQLMVPHVWESVKGRLLLLGFRSVVPDPEGYKSGG
jgi:uncharacterized protein